MMNWYETRISERVQHKGQMIPNGAKIYLSDAQKDLHNRGEEKVVKCEAPNSKDGVAVLEDWKVYQLNQNNESFRADKDVKEMPKSAADTTDGNSTDATQPDGNTKAK